MNYVGLDLSFTETGVSVLTDKEFILGETLIKSNSKQKPEERIIYIGEEIFYFLDQFDLPHMVYIEDKFVGKSRKQALYDGGLLYYIIIETRKHLFPYKIINPTSLKKFVIGTKGKKKGSKKELMLLHCFKKWGVEFENNNLCDAYCLARMAMEDMMERQTTTGNIKRAKRKP